MRGEDMPTQKRGHGTRRGMFDVLDVQACPVYPSHARGAGIPRGFLISSSRTSGKITSEIQTGSFMRVAAACMVLFILAASASAQVVYLPVQYQYGHDIGNVYYYGGHD